MLTSLLSQKRGHKIDLQNQRDICRVSVIRSILMKMIGRHISDGQIGARKGKGCESNIAKLSSSWLV